jgi:hypothetical protein
MMILGSAPERTLPRAHVHVRAREIMEEFRLRNHLTDEFWLLDMTGTGVARSLRGKD